jgi:hypothetical protein
MSEKRPEQKNGTVRNKTAETNLKNGSCPAETWGGNDETDEFKLRG